VADNRYRYPISDHINNTISIAVFVDLAMSWHPEVRRYHATATAKRTHRPTPSSHHHMEKTDAGLVASESEK